MPKPRTTPTGERRLTLTEQARRAQLIDVTIGLVAEHGYGGTSLARIAEGAEITKAAVLYHFPSKDAVLREAHKYVLEALVGTVAAAVEAAAPTDRPAAYIRSMIGHLREHPRHTRVIIEAMTDAGDLANTADRWRPLADLLSAACEPGLPDADARTLAIIIGGGIDSIVMERLNDPGYDTAAAADLLATLVERSLSESRG